MNKGDAFMTNIRNNMISLVITILLFIIGMGTFVGFANSKDANNSEIDATKTKDDSKKTEFYTVKDGNLTKVKEKASGDFGKNFSDITVKGELADDNGNIEFNMVNGTITGTYINNSAVPEQYSYKYLSYEQNEKYSVDSDVGADEMFQGYVQYNTSGEDESKKELCKYLKSNAYFKMIMCEDSKNVYTTINTEASKLEGNAKSIKNNALYKFDKKSHSTKKLCDLNMHEDNKYISAMACNEKYIYLLVNSEGKYSIDVYDKESASRKESFEVNVTVDLERLAKELVKEYTIRDVSKYETIDNGFRMFASDNGIVILKESVVAEIDNSTGKRYGENGYASVFEEKKMEPFVQELYTVTSFRIDGSKVEYDNLHVCKTSFMYDYMFYKNGITYVLTNMYAKDSDVLEKVKVTSISGGKLFDQININLNKISNTGGTKNLKYLLVE